MPTMPVPAVEVKLHRGGLRSMLPWVTGRRERAGSMNSLVVSGRLLLLAAKLNRPRPPEAEPW